MTSHAQALYKLAFLLSTWITENFSSIPLHYSVFFFFENGNKLPLNVTKGNVSFNVKKSTTALTMTP